MGGMNSASPLRNRRFGPSAASLSYAGTGSSAGVAGSIEDLKMFATVWLGGFVFFGTFFG